MKILSTHIGRLFGALLLLAVGLGHRPQQAVGQNAPQLNNMVVVSASSYDELTADLDFLGELGGKPALSQTLEGMIDLFTQGQGLAGLDKSKPMGAVVRTDGFTFQPLMFVAVEDLNKLLEVLALFEIESEDQGDGVFQLVVNSPAGPQTIHAKQHNGWAFVAQTVESLNQLPDNPLTLLDDLNEQYDIAVRVYVQNIPEMFRGMFIQQLDMGMQQGLGQLPEDSPEEAELRAKLAQNQLKSLKQLVDDTNHMTLGWSIDAQNKSTHVDFSLIATEGSETARKANQMADATSRFSGFLSTDAAVVCSFCGKYSEEDSQQMATMIDALRGRAMKAVEDETDIDATAREALKATVNVLLDVLKDTAEAGKMDGGLLVDLEPGKITFAAGAHLVDAERLENALRQVVELSRDGGDFPKVQWNVDQHEGVQFHTMTVPLPEGEDEVRQMLGDSLDIALGVGQNSFFTAVGDQAVDTLKGVIDRSRSGTATNADPMVFAVSMRKVMEFAATQTDDPTPAMMAESLQQAQGNDHIRITARVVTDGVQYRLQVEDGLLKAISSAASAVTAGPPADF